jgi:hypothetical protein
MDVVGSGGWLIILLGKSSAFAVRPTLLLAL